MSEGKSEGKYNNDTSDLEEDAAAAFATCASMADTLAHLVEDSFDTGEDGFTK